MTANAPTAISSPVRRKPLPPGPPGHWLWGHLREYRTGRLKFLEQLRAEYGSVVSYRLGRHPFVLVSEPELIEKVLVADNRQFRKFYITRMLKDVFGEGLVTSEGDFWLKQRRLIQPSFAAKEIAGYAEMIVAQTSAMLDQWTTQGQVELLREMQTLTMSIAAETLLGVKLPAQLQSIHEPHDLIRADFDRKVESLWNWPAWVPTPHNLRVNAAKRQINSLVDGLIREKAAALNLGHDMLSKLLSIQQSGTRSMSDVQIRQEALTFLFAGHETTASALTWAWYLVGTHPEVEATLHRELAEVLEDRAPTAADVPRLKYTEQIFLETLRLYPSAYGIGRHALHDIEWQGYRIPRGTNVVLSQWLTQRDARFFERPLEFTPNRWNPEFQRNLPHCAYFPFGAGPRVCIGNTFAMQEAILIIATIANRFRLQLPSNVSLQPLASVTLRPASGLVCTPEVRCKCLGM